MFFRKINCQTSWKNFDGTRNLTSPTTVVAVSANVIATEPVPGFPLLPEPFEPVCIAIALRAGTVAVNFPPEIVNLKDANQFSATRVNLSSTHDKPVQDPDELFPLMTSQYDPAAMVVVNVVLQAESALLIATNPTDPGIKCIFRTSKLDIRKRELTSTERNLVALW